MRNPLPLYTKSQFYIISSSARVEVRRSCQAKLRPRARLRKGDAGGRSRTVECKSRKASPNLVRYTHCHAWYFAACNADGVEGGITCYRAVTLARVCDLERFARACVLLRRHIHSMVQWVTGLGAENPPTSLCISSDQYSVRERSYYAQPCPRWPAYTVAI